MSDLHTLKKELLQFLGIDPAGCTKATITLTPSDPITVETIHCTWSTEGKLSEVVQKYRIKTERIDEPAP